MTQDLLNGIRSISEMRQSNRSFLESRNESSVDDSVSSTTEVTASQDQRASAKEKYKVPMGEHKQSDLGHSLPTEKVDDDQTISEDQRSIAPSDQMQELLDIKANYEVELETSAEKITFFKETIVELREENNSLRKQLLELKNNNHGQIVKDLEEECNRWENLYYQSAELGAARMSRLEAELEQLRTSSEPGQHTSNTAKEQIGNLTQALKYSFESAQGKESELRDYKQKSKERLVKFHKMLEKANAQKAQAVEELRLKEQGEQELLVHIEDLEADVKAKTAIIERERNQAAKRETRLKEQIRKLQRSTCQRKGRGGILDGAFYSMSSVLDVSLNWCLPHGKMPEPQ